MDGTEMIEGVEVPYIVTTVACTTKGCRAEGVPHEIRLYANSQGAACGPCSTARIRKGLPPHRHRINDEHWAALKALPEPEEWVRKRKRAAALEKLIDGAIEVGLVRD